MEEDLSVEDVRRVYSQSPILDASGKRVVKFLTSEDITHNEKKFDDWVSDHLTEDRELNNGLKKLVIELIFNEEEEDGYTHLTPVKVVRHPDTTFTEEEMSNLGDSIAQTDRWQVDNWIAIQAVLSGSEKEVLS